MIGQTLAHYKIEQKLGEGGMGVVYKALDTHLDRPVAIKVLRPESMRDAERKRRFVQEAKSASALNHPNIITIYDIDNAAGADFIAMEYVAGRTLDHHIGRQGLALNEALKYAAQMADALARAHTAGIIHRDLKPANLIVDEHGLVKVLDFGLAKLTEPGGSDEFAATMTQGAGSGRTEEGTILGTVAYMSPEQAQGKKLDTRSDVFSFGAVLYEMVTGRQPFAGETKMSTLAAVINKEPKPLSDVQGVLPRELERLILRCLRKDPDRRFHYMIDVKVALEELKEDSQSGQLAAELASPAAPSRSWRLPVVAAAGLILGAAAVGVAWWSARSRPAPSTAALQLTRLTADAGLATEPAISPDGKLVAYASDRADGSNLDVWIQQVPGGEPLRVTRHDADDREPSFSRDGARLAFRSERDGGGVYVVPALGGAERLLVKFGRNARFSPDGKWISYAVGGRGVETRAFVMPAGGGAARPLLPDFSQVFNPAWLPDSGRLAVMGTRDPTSGPDVWIVPLEGGAPVQTGAYALAAKHGLGSNIGGFSGCVTETRRMLFSAPYGDSTNLWQWSLSPKGQVEGVPQRLTFGSGLETSPAAGASRVVFASLTEQVNIWSLPLDAKQAKVTGDMQPLTRAATTDRWPTLSADGRKLAFLSTRAGNPDVWLKELPGGAEVALTTTPSAEESPLISPDGSRVAFSAPEGQKYSIYVAATTGGVPDKLCEGCGRRLWDWSPDGKYLAYQPPGGAPRIGLLEAASGRAVELLQHPKLRLFHSYFSPDGRWIAFIDFTSADRTRIWIASFRGPAAIPESDWIAVTDGEAADEDIAWSPDGGVLYFRSRRDGFFCLWAQRLEAATKKPRGEPFAIQHFHQPRRAMIPVAGTPARIAVAGNRLVVAVREITGNIWMTGSPTQ